MLNNEDPFGLSFDGCQVKSTSSRHILRTLSMFRPFELFDADIKIIISEMGLSGMQASLLRIQDRLYNIGDIVEMGFVGGGRGDVFQGRGVFFLDWGWSTSQGYI